jgi:hypothetical protein
MISGQGKISGKKGRSPQMVISANKGRSRGKREDLGEAGEDLGGKGRFRGKDGVRLWWL